MRALVTGATGFVGSHLAATLREKGYDVMCTVRTTSNLRWIEHLDVKRVTADLRDTKGIREALESMDYVFHCAGVTKARHPEEYFKGNAGATKNLIAAACEVAPQLKRFVYISSQAAIGPSPDGTPLTEDAPPHPVSPYGKSKLHGEEAVLEAKDTLPVTILRPTAIYGPRDTDMFEFFRYADRGMLPRIGREERSFNLVYVQDVVDAAIAAAESDATVGRAYFVTHPEPFTWKEAGAVLSDVTGKNIRWMYIPVWIVKANAYIQECIAALLRKPPLVNRYKVRELLQKYWLCSPERLKADAHFEANYNFRKGAEITYKWYRENTWL